MPPLEVQFEQDEEKPTKLVIHVNKAISSTGRVVTYENGERIGPARPVAIADDLGKKLSAIDGVVNATISRYESHLTLGRLFVEGSELERIKDETECAILEVVEAQR